MAENRLSVKSQLNLLFEYFWKKSKFLNDSSYFVSDGIMNSEEEWLSKKKRIASLLKYQPQRKGNWNDDVRNWMDEKIKINYLYLNKINLKMI